MYVPTTVPAYTHVVPNMTAVIRMFDSVAVLPETVSVQGVVKEPVAERPNPQEVNVPR